MTGLTKQLAKGIRRWLPHWLPWMPIALAWYQMLTTQLAQAAGSGG